MCSSSVTNFLPLHHPRRNRLFLQFSHPFPVLTVEGVFRPSNPRARRRRLVSLSASVTRDNIESSSDRRDAEDYNGWAILEETVSPKKRKEGLPKFLLFGIGTSLVALIAVFAHFTLSKKGYVLRFSSPFHVIVDKKTLSSEDTSNEDEVVITPLMEDVSEKADDTAEEVIDHISAKEKPGRVVVSVSADPTQQEALLLLKNLKIIQDEVKADELCSRREYARWLVLLNSRLERNPKNRIVPSVALAGSTINAFDDIKSEDPDFVYIQALAEAGVVMSKLSSKNLTSDVDTNFFPERFISREDLIGWRAKLEYDVITGLNEEILRNKLGFLDARELKSHDLHVIFMDMLANDKSIMRKVFGQVKRFQPTKPCTKAQAAVALTSGKTTELIHQEFSKIKSENSSRKFTIKEIKSELLERGDIQRFWEKKFQDEKRHRLEVESVYFKALKDLEKQKIDKENGVSGYLKEKAALECQKQLLLSLKEEVDEINEKLAYERDNYVDEREKTRVDVSKLEVKYERILDTKSILEAELEALRILRSWIEDEAKKGQARTKVLEEVERRWKWGSR
ncbi:hypothetical protein L2E82_08274 [Cichorium intybus]|uniref:Uncharacterized protein n=1 Tax=Cichorium intybus TaxID=13427 RepID=A0ACB9G747_CICIN|nr:hypothetical protein L2E82_08274 [Cichorium intybus]